MTNKIAVIIIVFCLAGAAVVLYKNLSAGPSGLSSIESGELYWIQCLDSKCGALYQIDRKDYSNC